VWPVVQAMNAVYSICHRCVLHGYLWAMIKEHAIDAAVLNTAYA